MNSSQIPSCIISFCLFPIDMPIKNKVNSILERYQNLCLYNAHLELVPLNKRRMILKMCAINEISKLKQLCNFQNVLCRFETKRNSINDVFRIEEMCCSQKFK